jgi:hypothetical protein
MLLQQERAMTKFADLAERHILEYESRLKHIDELLTRAHEGATSKPPEVDSELKELVSKRENLARHLEEMRLKSLEEWQEKEIERDGLMGIWDALAQQLEKFVERIER